MVGATPGSRQWKR